MILTLPFRRRRTGSSGAAASTNPHGVNLRPALGRWVAPAVGLLLLSGVSAGCVPGSGGSPAPVGWSPVAAAGGLVYVGTRQGQIQALNDTGSNADRVRWTYTPEPGSDRNPPAFHNPPAIGGTRLYVSSFDGYLYALKREIGNTDRKGEIAWKRTEGESAKPLVGGPALDPDGKLVAVGSENGGLYVYNAENGDPQPGFPFRTGDKIWSTPVIAGGVVYFGSHDNSVYAVSLADGRRLWQFPTGGAVVAQPLLFKDMVVVGSFDRSLYAINVKDGTLRWKFPAQNWFWAGAVSDGTTIFAPSMDGNLYALDAGGVLLWSHNMGSPIVSTPAVLPRRLMLAGKDGKLSLLDSSTANLGAERVLSSRSINGASITSPLTTAGTTERTSVYVGGLDSAVRRIDVKDNQDEGWCFSTLIKSDKSPCE